MQLPKLVTANLYFRAESGPRGLFCHCDVTDPLAVEALFIVPAEFERGPTPLGLLTPFEIGINAIRLGLAHVFRCRFLRDEIMPNFNPSVHVFRLEAMELRLVLRFSDRTQSREILLDRLWAMSDRLKEKFLRPLNRGTRTQETFDHDNWMGFAALLENDLASFLTEYVMQAVLTDRVPLHPVRFEPLPFRPWKFDLVVSDEIESA